MYEILSHQIAKNVKLKGLIAEFISAYYTAQGALGSSSEAWKEFLAKSMALTEGESDRNDALLQQFTQDYWRSASIMTPGRCVVFSYTTKSGDNKSYFVMIVAAMGARGVYANRTTGNNLMTCFLIDSGTNLNTLAILANVLQERVDPRAKSYSFLSDMSKSRILFKKNKQRGLSRAGLDTLFPKTKFRTFILTSMETVYEVDLDG